MCVWCTRIVHTFTIFNKCINESGWLLSLFDLWSDRIGRAIKRQRTEEKRITKTKNKSKNDDGYLRRHLYVIMWITCLSIYWEKWISGKCVKHSIPFNPIPFLIETNFSPQVFLHLFLFFYFCFELRPIFG